MKKQILFSVIFVLVISACQSSPTDAPTPQLLQGQTTIAPTPTTPPPTPTPFPKLDELVMAAMGGWNSDEISPEQVDLTLSYFADDAVFTMVGFPPQIPSEFKGKEAIRAAYESWIPIHPKLEVIIETVEGNTVVATTSYWSDPTHAMKIAPLVGKDVYTFVDGKITNETWTLTEESQTQFASAMATAAAPTPSPETLAVSLDELVGIWKGYWSDQTYIYFEIKKVGRFRTFFPNGEDISTGFVKFEDNKLIFTSAIGNHADICTENPKAEYIVYATKQGEQVIMLRFELVGEDYCVNREEYFNSRTLTPVKP